MNYILEINAFYRWLIENPISVNAQALWHRLMAYCNSFGWKEEFTITNTRLAEDLSISNQSLDRARKTLCQKGLITYEKGTANQCGTYRLIPFAIQNENSFGVMGGYKADTERSSDGDGAITLNKQNKNKQNKINYNNNTNEFKKSKFNNYDANSFGQEIDVDKIQQLLSDKMYENDFTQI